ncbi:hypothetical protein G6F56_003990 [Rhizopus delemar]|nr:hypothetical protein G6F56_003990 [Rhizopus delemar]
MCDVSDPRILNAYYAIADEEPTNWLLLGYKDSRNAISLYASGTNGLSEFRDNLTNEILFGFVRIEDKFILITYVPDSVNGVRRARALVHSRSVATICEISHAQITASSLSDLSDSNLRTRLKLNENQVPNRPKSVTKRSSVVSTRRRRSAQLTTPTTPTPPPVSTFPKRASLMINTAPVDDDYHIPSSPTSVASFSDTTTIVDCNSSVSSSKDYYERIKAEEDISATELLFQTQLLKKKELEESRFKQTLKEQQNEKERREQQIKRIEEEEKRIKMELQMKQRQLAEEREKVSLIAKRQSRTFDILRPNSPSPGTRRNTLTKPVEETKQVVMSGFASVQTKNSPFWKRRYFVIESTKSVLIYKDETSIKEPISTINLLHVTRLAPANEDEDTFVPNSFIIDTPSDSFQLLADDKMTGKKIYAILQGLLK